MLPFNFDRRMLRNMDWILIICIAVLLIFSVIMVYSASYSLPDNYVRTQIIATVLGCVVFTVAALFDYSYLPRFGKLIYAVMALFLVIVLVIGMQGDLGGGVSWIDLGPFRFQPAELAKVLLVVCLAIFMDRFETMQSFIPIIQSLALMAVPLLLVLLQPDMGSATVFIVIAAGMLFIYGISWKYLLSLALMALAAFPILWFRVFEDHQRIRLMIFLDPEANSGLEEAWQLIQSIIAIGSGGLWGRGYLQGSQTQLSFLPETQSDFIFSTIAEELGFVGAIFVIAVYLVLIWRIFSIARTSKDRLGCLMASGMGFIFLYHLLINVGMTIGIMPVIGIPLPLVSYANSNLISMMLGLGVVVSIALRRAKTIF